MKAIIKGFDYRFKDTRDACLLITVDKRCLADMPDIKKPMEITIKAKRFAQKHSKQLAKIYEHERR